MKNLIKELWTSLLVKLKRAKIVLTNHEAELDVGTATFTYILKDGSSHSIIYSGKASYNYSTSEVDMQTAKEISESIINHLNSVDESYMMDISMSKLNQHFVRRSDVQKFLVIHAEKKVKVSWQQKRVVKL